MFPGLGTTIGTGVDIRGFPRLRAWYARRGHERKNLAMRTLARFESRRNREHYRFTLSYWAEEYSRRMSTG